MFAAASAASGGSVQSASRQRAPLSVGASSVPSAMSSAQSTSSATSSGSLPRSRNAARPASQSVASSASGAPRSSRAPLQLGSAVSSTPHTIATAKPKSSSCA